MSTVRKTRIRAWVPAVMFLMGTTALLGQTKKLTAIEAKDHVGETATVCGVVASARYAASSKGQPTFLNLETPYPKQIFTVLIWGNDRQKFGQPEAEFNGKRICVTGKVSQYRGEPEIIADNPRQIVSEPSK